MRILLLSLTIAATAVAANADLLKARDAQDRAALDRMAQAYSAAAEKSPGDANAHYEAALAYSYAAEVATESHDKGQAKSAGEAGIRAAEKAIALNGNSAEYHRILGTLCGQVIPGNVFLAMKYGRCALDEVNKAIQLDGKSAEAYLSRGVGNYYMPSSFGGGTDPAIKDFEKAIQMDPKLADAYLWLGVALRKAGRNAEARSALEKAVQLNPRRVWAKQQLEKTPAK
jgi:tetratricopeptide (TPR) repeat protein